MSGRIPGGDRPAAGVRYRQTLGRWRLAFRLARRDLHRHTGRAVLIAVMVALPVAAGSFLVTTLESNEPYAPAKVEAELGPGLQATIEGIGGPVAQFRQPDDDRWFWDPVGWNWYYEDDLVTTSYEKLEQDVENLLPDGDRLVRALKGEVRLEDGDDATMSVAVQTDFTEPDVAARFPVLEGRLPRGGEIAVTEHHRDLGFDLGDTAEVTLRDGTTTTATISGVTPRYIGRISPVLLPEPGPLSPPEEVTSARFDFPLWYVTGPEPVTWSDVQDLNAAGAFVTSRDVLLDPPPTAAEGSGPEYVGWDTAAVILALIVVGLLEAIWLIGPAFAVGARRDTRSLALLAVNGASAPTLRAVMLARGLLTGAVGSVVGLGLGIAAAAVLVQAMPDRLPALRLPGVSLAIVLLVGVLVAVASAWPPARRAARADVATVLAGRRPAVTTSRRPTVVGAAAAVGGVVLAVVAGTQNWAVGLAAGIVVADLGLILACGGIVALLGRVAHRLPWTWRFALRDAARYRARTVPAIAAVLVAMAGASAALTYLDAEEVVMQLPRYEPWASTGTVAVTPGYGRVFSKDESERLQGIVDGALPDAGPVLPVPMALAPADAAGDAGTGSRRGLINLFVRPVGAAADSDEGLFADLGRWQGPVVTDGSDRDLLHALGIPEDHLDQVAEALADGRLPLPSSYVDKNGNARVSVSMILSDASPRKDVVLPAVAVGGPEERLPNLPILPEALLDEVGAESATGAYLIENPAVPSDEQMTLLQARADAALVGFDAARRLTVDVESGEHADGYVSNVVGPFATPWSSGAQPVMGLAIALAAVFLALVGTWSAVALSAVDARPDLATLAAVGAGPSARRRVVAAQAATISVIGSVLGLVVGTLIGVGWTLLTNLPLAVPWQQLAALAIAVPVLSAVAAWTVTSTRVAPARRRPL